MSLIFLVPLTAIALYESTSSSEHKNRWVECWLRGDEDAESSVENRNPAVDDPNCRGSEISRVPFEELVQVFPTAQVCYVFIHFGIGTLNANHVLLACISTVD